MSRLFFNIHFLLMIVIFVSIFLFARALISISMIAIILMYLISGGNPFKQFKQNRSLWFLFAAGALISINIIYLMFVNRELYLRDLFSFSNPLVMVLYVCAISYFLSQNKKYSDYLLYVLSAIVVLLSLAAFFIFLNDQRFIISDLYSKYNGGGIIQSVVAITFPFTAFFMLLKTTDIKRKDFKIILFVLIFLIIFADLCINRSKIGYLIEFFVLIYYCCTVAKYFSFKEGCFNAKRFISILFLSLCFLLTIFGVVYKKSDIFHTRVSTAANNFERFFATNYSKKDNEELSKTSTGLRLLYYISSVKIFKEYPDILILGCPLIEHTYDVKKCTEKLISSNLKIRDSKRIVRQISPHNEFIHYTFKAGILAGLSLFVFLMLLFYEARKLDRVGCNCLRVLTIALFVGCCFEYVVTTQMMAVSLFSILGILLSKSNCDEKG